MTKEQIVLTILIVYMAITMIVGIAISRAAAKKTAKAGFLNNYFMGGRAMGGMVLAMTLIATYTSASSFLGGPGLASSVGLTQSWLGGVQVGTAFLTLGVMGKRLAIIGRRIHAVSISDYLRARYQSQAVVTLSSLALVVFCITQMIAQFIGGATLMQTVTGLPYLPSLLIFAAVVIIYTAFGGFTAVVITDAIQGFIMMAGTFLLLFFVGRAGGGTSNLISQLDALNPGWDLFGGGPIGEGVPSLQPGYLFSYWILVGLGVMGLPQTAVRCMGFKDTQSLHRAMLYGTLVVGILMIGMHFAGTLALPLLPAGGLESTDQVIPYIVMHYMPAWAAGLFIAAPMAAIMSTVDSLMILASATLIKDLYVNRVMAKRDKAEAGLVAESASEQRGARGAKETAGQGPAAGQTGARGAKATASQDPASGQGQAAGHGQAASPVAADHSLTAQEEKKVSRFSLLVTLLIGVLALILAINPPTILVWINLFAMGGLEATFFWPLIGGLYWKKGTAKGCIVSTLVGLASFIFFNRVKIAPFGIHEIIPALLLGGLAYWLCGHFSKEEPDPAMLNQCF